MIDKILLVTQEGLDSIWCGLRQDSQPGLSQLVHGVGDYLRIAQQFDFDSEDDGMWVPTGRFWVTLTYAQRKHLSRQAEQDVYATKYEIVKSYRS